MTAAIDEQTPRILRADQVELGAVVYLVEDTDEGPRRTEWCRVLDCAGQPRFGGGYLGDHRALELAMPTDGRRVETLPLERPAPNFRTDPGSWLFGRWLIVDTETTGLGASNAIVELGAVIMEEGRVIEHRCALYNPGRPIEAGAAEVHGITDAMVASKPKIRDADPRTGRTPVQGLDALCAQHDVTAIVAYNGLAFDFPLMRRELGVQWEELEDGVGLLVDPLVVVRREDVGKFWKGAGRHRLTAVAEKLKLMAAEPGMKAQAHRAAWDCVLAGRILWRLREHLPSKADEVRAWQAQTAKQQRLELEAYHAAKNGGGT